jgi:hypothetical protein
MIVLEADVNTTAHNYFTFNAFSASDSFFLQLQKAKFTIMHRMTEEADDMLIVRRKIVCIPRFNGNVD